MRPDTDGALYAERVLLESQDESRIEPALIRWRAGVITEVRPCGRAEAQTLAPERIDLGDRLVAPAWVNAHTHLAMSALRGLGGDEAREGNVVEDLWFRVESELTRDDVRAFARLGALECLLCGTGAVFDHYYHADAVAEALVDVGLEGMVAPTLQDLAGPGSGDFEAALATTLELDDRTDLVERGIVVALGPHASDTVSDGLWARIVESSLSRELPVHVHVAQSPEEVARAREAGHETPIARLQAVAALNRLPMTLLVHGIYATTRDVASLDPSRTVHVHCPASQAQFAHPADISRWASIPMALGTDAGACNDAMNVQRELFLLAHAEAWRTTHRHELYATLDRDVAKGTAALSAHRTQTFLGRVQRADPRSALRAIGEVPGGVHPKAQWGKIAVGRRACLAAFDLAHPAMWPGRDPMRALAFTHAAAALHTLVVGGRVVGEVGAVQAILSDSRVAAWTAEADQRLEALLGRASGGLSADG
ncbi:MAG: hypothetical protein EA397_12835 [Deltaproteobacteria bacterium]|nr:MAG: hypothetical protein EA397_12835 [Deltaproteobacteria bacterium]